MRLELIKIFYYTGRPDEARHEEAIYLENGASEPTLADVFHRQMLFRALEEAGQHRRAGALRKELNRQTGQTDVPGDEWALAPYWLSTLGEFQVDIDTLIDQPPTLLAPEQNLHAYALLKAVRKGSPAEKSAALHEILGTDPATANPFLSAYHVRILLEAGEQEAALDRARALENALGRLGTIRRIMTMSALSHAFAGGGRYEDAIAYAGKIAGLDGPAHLLFETEQTALLRCAMTAGVRKREDIARRALSRIVERASAEPPPGMIRALPMEVASLLAALGEAHTARKAALLYEREFEHFSAFDVIEKMAKAAAVLAANGAGSEAGEILDRAGAHFDRRMAHPLPERMFFGRPHGARMAIFRANIELGRRDAASRLLDNAEPKGGTAIPRFVLAAAYGKGGNTTAASREFDRGATALAELESARARSAAISAAAIALHAMGR